MSRQSDLKELIFNHQYRLQKLKQKSNYSGKEPD
jgi:hypothetical protein